MSPTAEERTGAGAAGRAAARYPARMLMAVWIGFILFILAMLALDLGVFHREAKVISMRASLAWTLAWVALAFAFSGVVYGLYGSNWFGWADLHDHDLTGGEAWVQYITGYVLEQSLSLDNIFVIALIFASLRVPREQQHRVLFWGIIGAVAMRGIMIAIGAALIARFEWITYVFAGILLLTAIKMLLAQQESVDPERNLLIRLARRLYPVTPAYHGGAFFVKLDRGETAGRWAITPLFLALLLVESADVIFAVDSIPAIFAITADPFIVLTSNVFAILGLRSLFFALSGLIVRFRFLTTSLVFVLAYVAVKMLLTHSYKIPNAVSLAVIAGILGVGILASIVAASRDATRADLEAEGRGET
jgi:tellurite resistance protein TerC